MSGILDRIKGSKIMGATIEVTNSEYVKVDRGTFTRICKTLPKPELDEGNNTAVATYYDALGIAAQSVYLGMGAMGLPKHALASLRTSARAVTCHYLVRWDLLYTTVPSDWYTDSSNQGVSA